MPAARDVSEAGWPAGRRSSTGRRQAFRRVSRAAGMAPSRHATNKAANPPHAAALASSEGRRVRTRGPSSVTATVCSK